MLLIGRFSPRTEPVRLAALQFAVCAVLSLAGRAVARGLRPGAGVRAAAGPILYAGLLSTGVAYTLQVVAQQKAPPAHAAIILSLEAVFALLGGVVVLGESLGRAGAGGLRDHVRRDDRLAGRPAVKPGARSGVGPRFRAISSRDREAPDDPHLD